MNQLVLAIILSVLPISELRGGLPVAVDYALKNNLSIFPIFLMIVTLNILAIFIAFFFLDFLHKHFMKIKFYRKTFDYFLGRTRKKADKIEEQIGVYGFLALTLFVAVPLPATGAWTGVLIAWVLGLNRKKSILAISLGVLGAGIIVLLASLELFSLV